MRLSSLHLEGHRVTPQASAEVPDALCDLPDGPVGIALVDALTLLPGICDKARTAPSLAAVGLVATPDQVDPFDEEPLPVEATLDGGDPGVLIDPENNRRLRIRATFELDPPLFGSLRQHAVRDPRLVPALSEATLTLSAGLLWTTDLSTVSIDLLGLIVGGQPFSVSGSERPTWLPELLGGIASRIHRVPELDEVSIADRLLAASLSTDRAERARFDRIRRALAAPPFSLGTLELVRNGSVVQPCFGPDLLRARHFGPTALSALNLVSTIFLDEPDLLLVVAPDGPLPREALRRWLVDLTNGEGAVLEQILIARGGALP